MAQLTLPTWTHLYRVDRELHSLHGIDLPRPVALTQLATFFAVGGMVFAVLHLLGVALTANSSVIYLGPPVLLGYLSTHEIPFMDHRRPLGWACTQLQHLFEPSNLDALTRRVEADRVVYMGRCDPVRGRAR